MKKIIAIAVLALLAVGGAFSENKKENGHIGIGATAGVSKGFADYSADKLKCNIFLGFGFQVLGPLYAGFEGLVGVQKIGSDSATSTTITNAIYADGAGGYWQHVSVANYKYETNYWNIDLSPRVYASLDIADQIQALAFIGVNWNRFTYDSTVTGPTSDKVEKSSGVIYEAPTQIVMGLRGTLSIVYLEYTRFFSAGNQKLDWEKYANDRLSLGLNFRF